MDDINLINFLFFMLIDVELVWGGEVDEGGCWLSFF